MGTVPKIPMRNTIRDGCLTESCLASGILCMRRRLGVNGEGSRKAQADYMRATVPKGGRLSQKNPDSLGQASSMRLPQLGYGRAQYGESGPRARIHPSTRRMRRAPLAQPRSPHKTTRPGTHPRKRISAPRGPEIHGPRKIFHITNAPATKGQEPRPPQRP